MDRGHILPPTQHEPEHVLAAAAELDGEPGCELYLVNRQVGEPDVIWVTELWRSQDDLDASIERSGGATRAPP
jgi:quinol monooxygenase YgiN